MAVKLILRILIAYAAATAGGIVGLLAIAGDWEAPAWTADGRHLVCSRKHLGNTSLYLIDTWYGRARELTKCGAGTSLPACSASIVKRDGR